VTKWRKIAWGAALLIVSLVAASGLTAFYAKSRLAAKYPPPGELVDVGGYRLHWYCLGTGQPTVIFEAGVNEFSLQWTRVQGELAKTTRACSYDRAGFGWSERSPFPRSADNMVRELHTLLARTGTTGSLVMVGHSFGGVLAREYARVYPKEVAGMVLVDAAHEDYLVRIPEILRGVRQATQDFQSLKWISRFGLMALTPEGIPARGLEGDALARYRAVLATGTYFETAASETALLEQNLAAARALPLGDLGSLPLVVLSRGQADVLPFLSAEENAHYEREWGALQQRLAMLSSRSRGIIATHSGHDIHLSEPALVVDAVRGVITQTH